MTPKQNDGLKFILFTRLLFYLCFLSPSFFCYAFVFFSDCFHTSPLHSQVHTLFFTTQGPFYNIFYFSTVERRKLRSYRYFLNLSQLLQLLSLAMLPALQQFQLSLLTPDRDLRHTLRTALGSNSFYSFYIFYNMLLKDNFI